MRSQFLVLTGFASALGLAAACGAGGDSSFVSSGSNGQGGDDPTAGPVGPAVTSGNGPSVTSGTGGASSSGAGGAKATSSGTSSSATGAGNGGATSSGAGGDAACATGTADCDGNPQNGCETKIDSDAEHCGTCKNACPGGPGATPVCTLSTCSLACATDTADCDKSPQNGCEIDSLNDPKNCGGCNNDCMGATCVQGACACAAQSQTAQQVPLDLFIMLDKSASMTDSVTGGTKWSTVTTALKAFFTDPANAALGVGIQYFGLPQTKTPPSSCTQDSDCGGYGPCDDFFIFTLCDQSGVADSCDANDYSKAAVEIAPLTPAQGTLLTKSVNGNMPETDTPTAPALHGSYQSRQVLGYGPPVAQGHRRLCDGWGSHRVLSDRHSQHRSDGRGWSER